jgi:signal transduction histidine kinase
VESVAFPLDGDLEFDVGRPRNKRRGRSSDRPSDSALAIIAALSSYFDSQEDLPAFFGRVAGAIAGHTGADRAAFWRLGPRETFALQPAAFGFADDSPVHELRFHADQAFADDLRLEEGTAPELDRFWREGGIDGLSNSLAAPWRAGERRLGFVAVYDSTRGFTPGDLGLLRVAGAVAGMLWQYTESEEELGHTAVRLEHAMAARRNLINNIAAGGDEARRRFAATLHDDSLQLLTAAELQLERIRAGASNHHAVPLDQLRVTLRKVEDSLRRLLINVSPEPANAPHNLGEAISERLEAMRVQAGIESHVDLRLPADVPEAIQGIVLKNVSEALTNVEKHAHATRVAVLAEGVDGGIRVEVKDDGTGFVVAESVRLPGHIGLVAVRERAQLAGGWCRIESEPGTGTKLELWVPLKL